MSCPSSSRGAGRGPWRTRRLLPLPPPPPLPPPLLLCCSPGGLCLLGVADSRFSLFMAFLLPTEEPELLARGGWVGGVQR